MDSDIEEMEDYTFDDVNNDDIFDFAFEQNEEAKQSDSNRNEIPVPFQDQSEQTDLDHDNISQDSSYQHDQCQKFFNQVAQNLISFKNFERFENISPEKFIIEYFAFFKKFSSKKICKELINEYQCLIIELFGNEGMKIDYSRLAQRVKIDYFKSMAKWANYIFYYLTVLIQINIINVTEDQKQVIRVRDNDKKRRGAGILFIGNKICYKKPIPPGTIIDFELKPEHMLMELYFKKKVQSFYFNMTGYNYPK